MNTQSTPKTIMFGQNILLGNSKQGKKELWQVTTPCAFAMRTKKICSRTIFPQWLVERIRILNSTGAGSAWFYKANPFAASTFQERARPYSCCPCEARPELRRPFRKSWNEHENFWFQIEWRSGGKRRRSRLSESIKLHSAQNQVSYPFDFERQPRRRMV